MEVVGEQILPILPYIVLPLKRALDTQDEQVIFGSATIIHSRSFSPYRPIREYWFWLQVMINGLKLLQKLVMAHELVGQMLIPHFRQASI